VPIISITLFTEVNFQREVSFSRSYFQGEANFYNSEFYGKTYFSGHFHSITKFNYVLFERKEKVIFDIENLSNVSFMNTDLTGVRFGDKARWEEKKIEYDRFWVGKKAKEDIFKIVDERLLEQKIKENDDHTTKEFNLGSYGGFQISPEKSTNQEINSNNITKVWMITMEQKHLLSSLVPQERYS
jgi:hypothetical protein